MPLDVIHQPHNFLIETLPTRATRGTPMYGKSISITYEENENSREANVADWFGEAQRALKRLRSLQPNWDGYGTEAPNSEAIILGEGVLHLLRKMDLEPKQIVPSAEGGLGITFHKGTRYADVECFNSGEIVAVITKSESEPIVWELSPEDIQQGLSKIRAFLEE